MLILSYLATSLIGISLGLIGAGGSILTVPVLVYLFSVEPIMAASYSLFIVGTTALMGAATKYRQKLVDLKTALIFGAPSVIAVFVAHKYLLPLMPPEMGYIGNLHITDNLLIMVVFAVLMLLASWSMIRKVHPSADTITGDAKHGYNYPVIAITGVLVGVITGSVGAGGGFLIIPALVLLMRLPMKHAIGTSLLIIAAKSLIGFTADIGRLPIDWQLLLGVTTTAIVGMFIGDYLSKHVNGARLKQGFGWFVLVMGIYIIFKELFW